MSIGFGIEKLGLVSLKNPRVVGILVLVFTLICVAALPRAGVDGDLLRIYRDSGDMYDRYVALNETFGTFDNDTYILVTTDKMTDPAVLETLRDLAFDLELEDFSVGTLSPFSLRKPVQDGPTMPAVPEDMQNAEIVAAELTDLRENDPLMRNLIVEDLTGMVMIMFPDQTRMDGDGEKRMITNLQNLAASYTNEDIQVDVTGAPIWKTEMLEASVADQIKFSAYGFGIGFLTALLSFRSFWGAILATLTPFISVLWVMGSVTWLFGSFTFLTIIVTTLVMVIAFAESMFFCFTWLRLWREGMDPNKAIRETVLRVSPACALTSVTTVIAFGSLTLTQGQGILEFALSGILSVIVAYVTLVTFLPLALRIALKMGFKNPSTPSIALTAPVPVAKAFASKYRKPLAILGVFGTLALFYPHSQLVPRFSFQDYLPTDAESVAVAESIDSGVGGVSPIYIKVPLKEGVQDVSDGDYETIQQVHEILEQAIGKGKVISAASFSHYADTGFSRDQIFNAVGPFLKKRFVTDDGMNALITGFLPSILTSAELIEFVKVTDQRLIDAGIENAEVAGFRVLTSFASFDMIRSLQIGLTAAVFITIGVIGFAFRSWKIGLLSFVPNILPILGTEFYLYVSGAGLQMTTVIALTIAFGIAVDDTIHVLANYKRMREKGFDHERAVSETLDRVGPALIATTIILCAGLFIVVFSALPQVALFGTLTLITLVLALLGDLVILPAMLFAGGRFFDDLGGLPK